MADTIITVQGEHSAWYPAERATVSASVHAWGDTREDVFQRATTATESLRALVEPLHNTTSGPITWWSSDSVRVWTERPWNNEGAQLDPVFHAAVDFSVKFSDFGALAEWVEAAASIPDTAIGGIQWDLTEATRTSVTTEVRSRAVKDAVSKAAIFAQSIGLGSVKAIALADPGMLGDPAGVAGGMPAPMLRGAMKASADFGGAPALALKPEEIAVSAVVDARFVAS
ncbi:uncharacterized protein YggE [Microbacteriaceae bacterium SG_E_30_P1]|uniref:Uncharacterized protein YggE n=1 Tax=Antiquaquibacter oligotrophicus TaxID=2880260 RepID=A0ABT6KKE8_9MICO|nr:SIMPL domain-containing protein [Antiquaquibacter oligotrophicus]MDH6180487.1 uncharacterized protein YggE [Antiquaquibacter oligotrophicus]UDF13776.1 SIMPL domain-containing protein [Antiquaquibacter oligotrophicus]